MVRLTQIPEARCRGDRKCKKENSSREKGKCFAIVVETWRAIAEMEMVAF
jgi:hypothetical protein